MNWREYKERKEAQRYFRQNNDQFLSVNQWIKTIGAGLIGAIVIGIVFGALSANLPISFSVLYIVIGYAIANIMTYVSGVNSQQVAIASAVMTFIAFFVSKLIILIMIYSLVGFSMSLFGNVVYLAFISLFDSGLFELIFIVVGIFVAYQQAQ